MPLLTPLNTTAPERYHQHKWAIEFPAKYKTVPLAKRSIFQRRDIRSAALSPGSHPGRRHGRCRLRRVMSCGRGVGDVTSVSGDIQLLVQWIRLNGGFIHQSLKVEDDAACGCRGIVAVDDISLDNASSAPLVAVPAVLELTDSIARETLRPIVPSSKLQSFDALDNGALVVLLLAYERSQGEDSVYHPYIQSLPEEVSCPWNWPVKQWEERLSALSWVVGSSQWEPELRKAQSYVSAVSMGLCADFGQHFNVSAQDIRWALGIVASRGYGGDQRPGLIPFIDLFNHQDSAAPFYLQSLQISSKSKDSQETSGPQPFYTVWSSRNGQPQALTAGEEVYVDYTFGNITALDVFLSHGFVPDSFPSTQY